MKRLTGRKLLTYNASIFGELVPRFRVHLCQHYIHIYQIECWVLSMQYQKEVSKKGIKQRNEIGKENQ